MYDRNSQSGSGDNRGVMMAMGGGRGRQAAGLAAGGPAGSLLSLALRAGPLSAAESSAAHSQPATHPSMPLGGVVRGRLTAG